MDYIGRLEPLSNVHRNLHIPSNTLSSCFTHYVDKTRLWEIIFDGAFFCNCQAIIRLAMTILYTAAITFCAAVDLLFWVGVTITIIPAYRIGIKKHLTNLVSIVALPLVTPLRLNIDPYHRHPISLDRDLFRPKPSVLEHFANSAVASEEEQKNLGQKIINENYPHRVLVRILFEAVRKGEVDLIDILMRSGQLNIRVQNHRGNTILMNFIEEVVNNRHIYPLYQPEQLFLGMRKLLQFEDTLNLKIRNQLGLKLLNMILLSFNTPFFGNPKEKLELIERVIPLLIKPEDETDIEELIELIPLAQAITESDIAKILKWFKLEFPGERERKMKEDLHRKEMENYDKWYSEFNDLYNCLISRADEERSQNVKLDYRELDPIIREFLESCDSAAKKEENDKQGDEKTAREQDPALALAARQSLIQEVQQYQFSSPYRTLLAQYLSPPIPLVISGAQQANSPLKEWANKITTLVPAVITAKRQEIEKALQACALFPENGIPGIISHYCLSISV